MIMIFDSKQYDVGHVGCLKMVYDVEKNTRWKGLPNFQEELNSTTEKLRSRNKNMDSAEKNCGIMNLQD